VYQSERYGNHSYTVGSLTSGASYTVRLHFAETKWLSSGARVFNVLINGAQVLTNLDIFAMAGSNRALVLDFNTTASSAGQIKIQYVSVVDNAKSSALEILSTSTPSNQAPTVAISAAADPNPAAGLVSALSVLGADDGGESNLIYTWAVIGTPPAPVSFSRNGSNAAKNSTATFTKAGSYSLVVTIKDASASSVTSSVSVVVGGEAGASAIYRINCGGGAVSPFAGDQFASGGSTWTSSNSVSTAALPTPHPRPSTKASAMET